MSTARMCGVWSWPKDQASEKAAVLAPEDEVKAVSEVTQRLAVSFPDVDVVDVEHAVHRSYEAFTGKPIRDFVPVLVERMARDDLLMRRSG